MRQALDQQRQETVQMVKTLGQAMEKITSKDKTGVVDVKAVGKPEMLQGETKEQIKQRWPLWAFGFTTWFVSQHEKSDEMLKWAASYNGAIDEAVLDAVLDVEIATRTGWDDAHRVNRQLHVALVSLTKGETLSILRNSVAQSGLDGWRRLSREYEPQTAQSNYHLLAKVLRPARTKELSSLRGAIETWERLYTQYQERTSDSLSDATRRLCLQSLCPDVLSDHLDLHASRLGTYDMMRAEIDTYLDIKTSTPLTGGDPMDVDAMGKGKEQVQRQARKGQRCWRLPGSKGSKGQGKDGKGKRNDGKGKGTWKGGKSQDSKGKGKGVKSLEESGEQATGAEAGGEEIQAIFALDAGRTAWKRARKEGPQKGQGKGTGSTESFIRHVLTNLRAVEAREINRAKEDLRKENVTEERREALEAEIAERQGQLDLLKGRSARFEEDPRYRQDVRAGQSTRLAKRKWKSRVRAAANRAKGSTERARERRELDNQWYAKFRGETSDDGLVERQRLQIDRHGGRFEGDREDLEPDLIMRPLSRKEKQAFRQEEDEGPTERRERSWAKPQWMRRNTPEAKKKHMKKTGWRISMLKQRSKEKKAAGWRSQDSRRGSVRPSPSETRPEDRQEPVSRLNLEDVADKAWARKKIKDLSRNLDNAEDEDEALRMEEEIQVHKAKLASLEQGDPTAEVRSSTAAGSRDVVEDEYEEVPVEEEYEEVPIEEEPTMSPEDDEDECWGKWKPSSCLVDLGFSKEEADSLVREYQADESVDNLEVFSIDQPTNSDEWVKVMVTVDSGSAVTCFPEELVEGYPVGEHHGPKEYTSASNHSVKSLGSANPVVGFEDYSMGKIEAVVLSPLKRPLFSTGRMVRAGWRVVHDLEENGGSFARHRASGRKLKMYLMDGVYKMPIWVKKHQGFGRRGVVP
eukprot:s1055_g7.t1